MPLLAPFLRTTLLLSSLGLAATYALYENNPAFRAFVDNTVDKILAAWDSVLASLSPEEQQRQRDAQRREVLSALSTRGDASGVRSVLATGNAAGRDDSAAAASGDQAAMRRRRLWQIAQRNATAIGEGIGAVATDLDQRADVAQMRARGQDTTLFSNMQSNAADASAPDPPESVPEEQQPTARSAGTASSSGRIVPITIQSGTSTQTNSSVPITLNTQAPPSRSTNEDDTVSLSGTSTASLSEDYSNIHTPTSPSVQSISDSDFGFISATENVAQSSAARSRSNSIRSASTETMSHFTQSAPPSIADADDDDMSSWASGASIDGEFEEMGDEDPSSAAAWEQYKHQTGAGGPEQGRL